MPAFKSQAILLILLSNLTIKQWRLNINSVFNYGRPYSPYFQAYLFLFFFFIYFSAGIESANPLLLLRHVQITFQYSRKSLLELLVGQCVTKRVDGAVCVTQEIREHKQMLVGARFVRTKTLH